MQQLLLYKIIPLMSILTISWIMVSELVSIIEGNDLVIISDLEKLVETIPIENFEGDTQLTQNFDHDHRKTVYTFPHHDDRDNDDEQVIYERPSTDTNKSTIIFYSPQGGKDGWNTGRIKIKNLRIYVGFRRNPLTPSSYYIFYVYLRHPLPQDDLSTLSVLGNGSFIVEFDSWEKNIIGKQSQNFIVKDLCSYSSVLVPCRKFQMNHQDDDQLDDSNKMSLERKKKSRRVKRNLMTDDDNNNISSSSGRSLFGHRRGFMYHRKPLLSNLLGNLLGTPGRPPRKMIPTIKTKDVSTTTPLAGDKERLLPKKHVHPMYENPVSLTSILRRLTGLLYTHRKLEGVRMWRTRVPKHHKFNQISTTTEPGETNLRITTQNKDEPGLKQVEESTVDSTAFKMMQEEEDENIDAEKQLEGNRRGVKGGALVNFEQPDYPDDDYPQGTTQPPSTTPTSTDDEGIKRNKRSLITTKVKRQKRIAEIIQRPENLFIITKMSSRQTKLAGGGGGGSSPKICSLNFGLEFGGMCPYEKVTLKNFTETKRPQQILRLYLTILRMNCIQDEVDYFQKLFNHNCLAVMRRDQTLKIPQTCSLLKKKKLTDKELRQLSRAFELAVFSTTVFHNDQLFHCSRNQQCSFLQLKNTPDNASKISHSAHLLGKFVFSLYPMMNQNEKLFQHFVRLHQNILKTLQIAYEKLVRIMMMMQSQDCPEEEKEVNFNDRIYLKSLIILFKLHGPSMYLNGHVNAEDEFKKKFLLKRESR